MKSFLRDNPTIAFGLGLPLFLVLVFLLISGIPSLLVAAPKHDVLYATDYRSYQNSVQISVVSKKVQVIYHGSGPVNQRPRLWRYIAKTGAVQEIPIILPPSATPIKNGSVAPVEPSKSTVIDVPDVEALVVDSSSIAPDGYEFNRGGSRYSRNIFGGLFYSSRYRNEAVLTKNGRSIRLPNVGDRYYSRNTQFIGWVVSQ